MQQQEVYRREDYWSAFLAWEHKERRVIHGRQYFMPGDDVPDSKDEVLYEDEEEYAPRAVVKLEAVLPDAAITAAMAASLADEEAKWSWPGLDDIV
jgi:hypothetical protein